VEYSTGRFEIRGVPDGNYRLRVYQKGAGDQVLYGEQHIRVDGRDTDDAVVALAIAPTLKGTVRAEPPGGWMGLMRVHLDPQDPFLAMSDSLRSRDSTGIQDGRFEIRGVIPGKYWVGYLWAEIAEYIASARSGQADLLASSELVVERSGAAEIELVLRGGFGHVRVTLGAEAPAFKEALLLLEPESCERPPQIADLGPVGFDFITVPPGKYRLHAWKGADDVELDSHEAVCALGRSGIPVEVTPGAEVTLDLAKLPEESK
jgi:hypothetical protein